MVTEVNETVETLVHFQKGSFKPLKFRWRGRVIAVTKITGRYQTKNGEVKKLVFAVESGVNVYQLEWNLADLVWSLTSVFSEG